MKRNNYFNIVLSFVSFLVPLLLMPCIWGSYNLPKLYILFAAGFMLLLGLINNYKTLKVDKTDYLAIIFGVLVIISTFFAIYPGTAIWGQNDRFEGTIMFLIYILIYYTGKYFYEYNKPLLKIMAVITGFICSLAILQHYITLPTILGNALYPIFNKDSNGTFGNCNFFGSFVSMAVIASMITYIFIGKKRYLLLSSIAFFSMIVCMTRSAWVAFGICSIFGLIFLIKEKNVDYWKRAGAILGCFIILFTVACTTGKDSILHKGQVMIEEFGQVASGEIDKGMGSGRIEIWQICIPIIKEYPIFGCGPDLISSGILSANEKGFYEFIDAHGVYIDKAHNEYLQIACTLGLPALTIYLIFLALILVPKMEIMFKNKVYFALFLIALAYLIQAFFNISTIGVAPLFWLLLGLISNPKFCEELNNEIGSTKLLE